MRLIPQRVLRFLANPKEKEEQFAQWTGLRLVQENDIGYYRRTPNIWVLAKIA